MDGPADITVLLADPAELPGPPPALWAMLDAADRTHAARRRQAVHRHEALCSRAVQRLAVAALAGSAPHGLRFEADAQGRPRALGSAAGVAFSATNCAGLVACAAGRGLALGLDAEPLARTLAPELLEACLGADERRAVQACAPPADAALFHRLWVLKEAWFKARGLGIDRAPAEVGFDADLATPRAAAGSPAAGWCFQWLPGAPAHALALCSERPVAVRVRRLRLEGARLAVDDVAG